MEEGLRRFYSGEFHGLCQEWHEDGTVTMILWEKGSGKKYRFRVRNLRGLDEEVLGHEEIVTPPIPLHILQRMETARKGA